MTTCTPNQSTIGGESCNAIADDEYEIGYAYATSPLAIESSLKDGGWVLRQSAGRFDSFVSYEAARDFATKLHSVPSRWSFDHPMNAGLRLVGR